MKQLVAILTLLVAGTAFAGSFGSVEYGYQDIKAGGSSDSVKVMLGTDLTDNLKIDVGNQVKSNDATGDNGNRLESGLTLHTNAGIVSPYVRAALGQKYTTNDNYGFWSVEPGIKFKTPIANVTGKLGYRYRDAMDTSLHSTDMTKAWKAGLEYQLTSKYSVGINYDRVRGDSEYDSYNVSLGLKF